MTLKLSNLKSGLISFGGALISSLCCLLPFVVILFGLGTGAFMAATMRYRAVLLPLGLVAVGVGSYLYFREKRRCVSLACQMVGARTNLALLIVASVMLAIEVVFALFPQTVWSLMSLMTEG
jgi:hypothetical protein